MPTLIRIRHIKELFPFHGLPQTMLGVFAHPDDESLCMGGTFALAHAERIRSLLVTITRGERGGKFSRMYGKKLALKRTRELQCAADILNITSVQHLWIPDGGVDNFRLKAKDALIDVIIKNTPQIIVTHDPLDTPQHPDHIATARAVIDAVLDVNPPWAHVVLFATLKPTLGRFTYALDIDAYRDIKIKACRAHVSQGLFHGVRLPVPVDVYYAINHFEYFQLYEKETRPNA